MMAVPPSAALLAANERLLALRAARGGRQAGVARVAEGDGDAGVVLAGAVLAELPSHLGWESAAVGQQLRARAERVARAEELTAFWADFRARAAEVAAEAEAVAYLRDSISIFGCTLDLIGRQKKVSCGRIWLLARYLDRAWGSGRVAVGLLRQRVVAEWGVLSWKRVRQIMIQGEGLFWRHDRRGGCLYYVSEMRLLSRLGARKVRGAAVAVPIRALLGSIKEVRALFYDGYHSGRGDGFGAPISRGSLSRRGSGDRRTLRGYERLRGMGAKENYLEVGRYERGAWVWERGRVAEGMVVGGPLFLFVDYDGRHGRSMNRPYRSLSQQHWHHIYMRRQLANSYRGTLRTVKRGKRWLNDGLAHLSRTMHRMGSASATRHKLYHRDAKQARRYSRQEIDTPHYYPVPYRPQHPRVIWQESSAPTPWG
ncbi:MAG TPA: hypothetical protein VLL52_25995 [Anaerolineae bacterium]|nr:hypothetical protein [Anaerolineae bacterium]